MLVAVLIEAGTDGGKSIAPRPKEEPKEEKPKTEGAALGFLGEKRWEKGR